MHGLNGNPHDTWTSQKNKIFWPAQLLPQFIEEEKVRVLVWGYDADITAFAKKDGVTKDKIHNHAEKLVAELFANRRVRAPKNLSATVQGTSVSADVYMDRFARLQRGLSSLWDIRLEDSSSNGL